MIARLCLLLPLVTLLAAQSSPWTMARLPGTGQTGRFTTTFGQDSDFALNPPTLAVNGDGAVADMVTGLLWQQADGGEMTWEKAGEYCKSLSLGGYRDWRLPFAHEAFSILNHNASRPALDTGVFTPSSGEYWWAAETRADDPSRVWVTNAGGGIGPHPKSETVSAGGDKPYHVRCVRSALKVDGLYSSFTDNGDGTVIDSHTGLVWQQQTSEPLTWEEALSYAGRLELAGHDDWRLPNIKELRSLNDDHVTNPSLNRAGFPASAAVETWSSTTLLNHSERAWTVDFTYGIGSYRDKTEKLRVRSVRGGLKEVVTVSAASYELNGPVAPGSIASAFGEELATGNAASAPDTVVLLTEAGGTVWRTALFAVTPSQVNFLVPETAAVGLASLVVTSGGRQVGAGVVRLERVAPGLFTANANGKGVAAALAVRAKVNGAQTAELIFQCGTLLGGCSAVPIDPGNDSEPVFLSLFGTGMRGAGAQATATIGGTAVSVTGPLAQGQYAGLDQVNLGPLPRSLAGRGEVEIVLSAGGKTANKTTVSIK
jgi:uncharacterized protein (TIGR03437 family)